MQQQRIFTWAGFGWRLCFLGLIWLGLTGTDKASWLVGGPCVVLAAWLSTTIRPSHALRPLSPWGMFRLLMYFLAGSLAGGMDVARRVLLPSMPVVPGYQQYTHRLEEGPARRFFMLLLNILPGTLSASSEGDTLTIHCIDHRANLESAIHLAEDRVACAFRAPLAPQEPT